MPIFYSALLLTGVNLLLRFVSTSFQVFISGKLGAAGVGLLQLVLSVGTLATTAAMAGARTATMYLTAEELGRKRDGNIVWVLSGCFLYSILCSGTVCFLLYWLAPFVAENWVGVADTAGPIRLLAAFLPISCLCGVMTGYFTAANRIGTLAVVEVAEQLCSMVATISLLSFWAGSDPIRACEAVILGSSMGACITLVVLVILRMRAAPVSGMRIPVSRRLLHVAVPLALADDLRSGISTTENLMVPKRLALYPAIASPLSAFGMVCGMVFPVLMFPAAIIYGLAELLIPELARCAAAGSQTRIRYLSRKSLRITALYGFFFSGGMFLLSEWLCHALYGNGEAGHWLRWYALLIPMLYCDAITDAMIKGLGQQTASVRYNILTSALDVAFLYLLLPKFGMAGYYASFLVTHVLNFFLSLRRLLKTTKNRLSLSAPLRIFVSAALSVLLGMQLNGIWSAVAYVLSFSSLLTLFRVVGKSDLQWISGLVRKK